ncbi:MAG: hypothetical protein RSE56_03545 [Bacilli bacterium]|uniref:HTH domain-containing protein n=1 Tax=Algoriella sp. TaxID=1872434 RepID=UPI002FC93562
MEKKYFTDAQVKFLKKNKYVKRVSNKAITYQLEFKELFLKEYGPKKEVEIFEDAGLPLNILGICRIKNCSESWRRKSRERGSVEDTRKNNLGRPTTRNLTKEEIIERLKFQVETLKQENEFLRQIQRLERRYQPQQSPSKKHLK